MEWLFSLTVPPSATCLFRHSADLSSLPAVRLLSLLISSRIVHLLVHQKLRIMNPSYIVSLLLDGVCNNIESSPLKLDTLSSLGSLHCVSTATDEINDAKGLETRVVGPRSHGVCLTLNDHEHIRQFIQEFTFRGLLPHIEKNIRQLNDQVLLILHNLTALDIHFSRCISHGMN